MKSVPGRLYSGPLRDQLKSRLWGQKRERGIQKELTMDKKRLV